MRVVWKFPLKLTRSQNIWIPENYQVLDIQLQDGGPVMWAFVDPEVDEETRVEILTYGTGFPIEESVLKYLATYQLADGTVWHVFEK